MGEKKTNIENMIYLMNKFKKEKKETYNKRAKKIAKTLLENPSLTPEQRTCITNSLETIEKRLGKLEETNLKCDNKEELRDNMYEGKIDISVLKELVDKYSKTARGCIFIAEICKYFRLEEQGVKCLKGYKRQNATTIRKCEQNAISQAMELLNQKKAILLPKEKWDKVYDTLEKASEVETHSCEEK